MSVPRYSDRNRAVADGGPRGVLRSSASQHREFEPLFASYEHLQGPPRADSALDMLRKVASLVKPIMRKRGWRVRILAEFLPQESNLLGLNINKGYKICIRLRYHNNPDLFLPLEEVVDTMLHELSHNVWSDHDSNFHALWEELRDEHETLVRKGYSGEGFLGEGRKLGGRHGNVLPQHEMRRLARASADKRKTTRTLAKGSGQRLGGVPIHHGQDIRQVIVNRITRRNTIDKGCGSGRKDADKISDRNDGQTFKTKAEEDDANDRAIAEALYDLIEEEEDRKTKGTFQKPPAGGGLAWSAEQGLIYHAGEEEQKAAGSATNDSSKHPSEEEQLKWALQQSMASANREEPVDLTMLDSPPTSIPSSSKFSSKTASRATSVHDERMGPVIKKPRTNTEVKYSVKREPAPETPVVDLSEPFMPEPRETTDQWACEICTCINPTHFLTCDACGVEKSERKPKKSTRSSQATKRKSTASSLGEACGPARSTMTESLGWNCNCGAFMEHKWWTCSACGSMKTSS